MVIFAKLYFTKVKLKIYFNYYTAMKCPVYDQEHSYFFT